MKEFIVMIDFLWHQGNASDRVNITMLAVLIICTVLKIVLLVYDTFFRSDEDDGPKEAK